MASKSPTVSTNSRIKTPSATVSRPGSSTPIVITSFAMKDCERSTEFNQNIQMCTPMDLDSIMDKLKECDAIKYAAYRTATKLDILRSALRLDQVKLGAVTSAFHQHGVKSALSEAKFSPSKAADVIADIFFSAGKIRPYFYPTIDVSACTDVARRVAFMVFDNPEGIGVAFLKVFFTILCEARLKDKLAYLFKDFLNPENPGLMTKKGIKAFLMELTRISDFFGESESFGSHLVDSAVAQCLHVTNQKLLDEDMFFKWIFREPQVIVWLPTFYRMIASKSIRHDVRCANCRSQVIIGMRYQCLQCINYDLCQHCFFYGMTSGNHKISHPMQEYCYKSTKKEATRALLKLVANNLGLSKTSRSRSLFKKKERKRRYLPHDPEMVLEQTVNETIDEQPVTVEALNLHPMIQKNLVSAETPCSSGFHSVSSTSNSPVQQNSGNAGSAAKLDNEEKQKFNSILQVIEKENTAVLERLTSLQASRNKIERDEVQIKKSSQPMESNPTESLTQPIDSCVAMQAQLNRLKLLMEGLFGCPDLENGCETPLRSKKQIIDQRQTILMELQNSLNEPSLIESTPLVTQTQLKNNKNVTQFQLKKLSRLALDSNFSPIQALAFNNPKSMLQENKRIIAVNTPVFDESVIVDTLLNEEEEELPPLIEAGSPSSISKINMSDITSFMAKTGFHHDYAADLNITKQLMTPEEEEELFENFGNGDLMEEMEKIMVKMDEVMATFKDPSLLKKSHQLSGSQSNLLEQDPAVICRLVAEISDLIHAQTLKQ